MVDLTEQIKKFDKEFALYSSLLTEWNQKFNLTAIEDRESIFARHFADSLAAAEYIPCNATVCDIGSGAGFPGLPLKIVRPDIDIILIDSVNKKVGFLNEVIARLNLKNAAAVHIRAEDAATPSKYREKFDITLSRAVAPLAVLCEYALPLTKTGGAFIAYKTAAATDTEIKAAENALKILGGKIKSTVPYTITAPAGTKGSETANQTFETIPLMLIIIEKTAPCPAKYPRGGNKPRLQPL